MPNISKAGLDHIAGWEGLELQIYLDAAGYPTIGYGHLLTRSEMRSGKIEVGNTIIDIRDREITEDEALDILRADVLEAEACVNHNVNVGLHQAQFDALVSFVFNVGCGAFRRSTLLRKLNKGDYDGAQREFSRWVYAGGRKLRGLANRRASEAELFAGNHV